MANALVWPRDTTSTVAKFHPSGDSVRRKNANSLVVRLTLDVILVVVTWMDVLSIIHLSKVSDAKQLLASRTIVTPVLTST